MDYGRDGSVRISNREYIGDILSTLNDYVILSTYLANPAIYASFPWLSSVANSFEKFCFNNLCYHYVTQSPTTSAGSVIISPDYNTDASPPSNKQQALALKDTVRSPAWQESCCVLPEDRLCNYKDYYVQINPSDSKLSIPANIYIGTSGGSDSAPITGELWVEYDIVLSCPMASAIGSDNFLSAGSPGELFPPFSAMGYFPSLNPMAPGTGATYLSTGVIDSIILPVGQYILTVTYSDNGTGDAFINPTFGSSIVGGSLNAEYGATAGGKGMAFANQLFTVSSGSLSQRTVTLGIVSVLTSTSWDTIINLQKIA
jgi:hypothetical protein